MGINPPKIENVTIPDKIIFILGNLSETAYRQVSAFHRLKNAF